MLTSQPSKNSNNCLPPFAPQENLKGPKSMGTRGSTNALPLRSAADLIHALETPQGGQGQVGTD